MPTFLWILLSVSVVSLLSFIGVITLAITKKKLHSLFLYLVAFAAGALLGNAFLHLLPQSLTKSSTLFTGLLILVGIIFFYIIEMGIHWHQNNHHHHQIAAFGITNLIGDGLHNLIDGMIIAGSFLVSIPLGITTTIAIILHEIPQEVSDFGVLVHAGFSIRAALFVNFLSALSALLGAMSVYLLQECCGDLTIYLLPLTAGGFIYIGGSNLIPEVHKHQVNIWLAIKYLACLVLGMGIMVGLLFIE